jgi:hypothetical protein
MTWPQALLVGASAAASMASVWFMICSVLPSIRLREAAAVNLGSTAVANTLPAGGALAMGVSWAMLSSWGISTADYVLYTLVSGIWNVFARLGLPVLALLVLMTASPPGAGLIVAAGAGLALLVAAAAGLGLLLHSESFALRAGRVLQRMVAVACRLARRPLPPDAGRHLPAPHPPRRDRLPHMAARTGAYPQQPPNADPAGQSPGAGTCQRRPMPQPDKVSARHFPGQPAASVSGRK